MLWDFFNHPKKYSSHLIQDHDNITVRDGTGSLSSANMPISTRPLSVNTVPAQSFDKPNTSDGRPADPGAAAALRFLHNINDSDESDETVPLVSSTPPPPKKINQIYPCHLCASTWYQSAEELKQHCDKVHGIQAKKRHACNRCNASYDR